MERYYYRPTAKELTQWGIGIVVWMIGTAGWVALVLQMSGGIK